MLIWAQIVKTYLFSYIYGLKLLKHVCFDTSDAQRVPQGPAECPRANLVPHVGSFWSPGLGTGAPPHEMALEAHWLHGLTIFDNVIEQGPKGGNLGSAETLKRKSFGWTHTWLCGVGK